MFSLFLNQFQIKSRNSRPAFGDPKMITFRCFWTSFKSSPGTPDRLSRTRKWSHFCSLCASRPCSAECCLVLDSIIGLQFLSEGLRVVLESIAKQGKLTPQLQAQIIFRGYIPNDRCRKSERSERCAARFLSKGYPRCGIIVIIVRFVPPVQAKTSEIEGGNRNSV